MFLLSVRRLQILKTAPFVVKQSFFIYLKRKKHFSVYFKGCLWPRSNKYYFKPFFLLLFFLVVKKKSFDLMVTKNWKNYSINSKIFLYFYIQIFLIKGKMGKTDLITCIKRKTLIKIFIACGISENNKKKHKIREKKLFQRLVS